MLHHHHDHGQNGAHHHVQAGTPGAGGWRRPLRFAAALAILIVAVVAACTTIVHRGEAVVFTRFGDPVRIVRKPGLTFKAPMPVENAARVDLRLQSLSSGLQDVGTKDGLRILVQAYVIWRVGSDDDQIRRFIRTVRNDTEAAASQLRSFAASSLELATSRFDLASLINTDRSRIRSSELEGSLREQLQAQVEPAYGIVIEQVGLERLTLPAETLDATVARMSAERMTAAQQRRAEGNQKAAEIRSVADRDARILLAETRTRAAEVEAQARVAAFEIYGRAYRSNPELYSVLRTLDTLDAVIGENTRLILRTDAAPLRALVDRPTVPKPMLPQGPALSGAPADALPEPLR